MKKIITLILFVFVVQAAFTQSAYQTKCHQIFIKYLKMFTQGTGITMNAGDEIAYSLMGYDEYGINILKPMLVSYCAATGKNYNTMYNQIEREYAAAHKLLTSAEKAAIQQYEEKKFPWGVAKWQAADGFRNWMQKDEFESTPEFEKRLKELSVEKFDIICYNCINYYLYESPWKIKFGNYHADEQELELIFYLPFYNYEITYTISLDAEKAKTLKRYNDIRDNYVERKGFSQESYTYKKGSEGIRFEYNTEEICEIDKKVFVPRYFVVNSMYGNWTFDVSEISNINIVKFKFDDLFIYNNFVKGHIFDCEQYAVVARIRREEEQRRKDAEKARQDSLAVVRYNDLLKEELEKVNQELRERKYNIYGRVLEKKYEITVNSEDAYRAMLYQMQQDETSLATEFLDEHTRVWDEYWMLYGGKGPSKSYRCNQDEFDKYYCQGPQVFIKETYLRSTLYQLKKETITVSMLDIQKDMAFISKSDIEASLSGKKMIDFSIISNTRTKVLTMVAILQNSPHYKEAVKFMIDNNKALNKEFVKNGSKFSSIEDFYKAYTSVDYKNILKSKK